MYKLKIVSKQINPPENGCSNIIAQCEFYQGTSLLIEDIIIKSPVESFQVTAEERCEELSNLFDIYNEIPIEITVDRVKRKQAKIELQEQEKVRADQYQESLNNPIPE